MPITHDKVSAKTDTADPTLVQASDWNDDHEVVGIVQAPPANGGTGGLVELESPSGDGSGGPASIAAGTSVSGHTGAEIRVTGGTEDDGGRGGSAQLTGGDGASGPDGHKGGNVQLQAGAAASSADPANGGDVALVTGLGAQGGRSGWVGIYGWDIRFIPRYGHGDPAQSLTYHFISGTADPTAGAGEPAPIGSQYTRDNAGVGELWFKTGAADTDWTKVI